MGSTSGYTQSVVCRPGFDPGTLGLKEGYGWSEWSGGVGMIRESKETCPVASDLSDVVGMVRGKLRGISERVTWLGIGSIDH